ncbi:MAG: NAD(P)H-hydrate dehydratase [Halobacteriovoraceae bacterium]|nr:NAD(P)H-hydrate dehydratase [Halobacteriovoraceae bacterium]
MKVLSKQEMITFEQDLFAKGFLSEDDVIENIGFEVSKIIKKKFLKNMSEVIVLMGPGNNGSDGLSIARYLHHFKFDVSVFRMFPDKSPKAHLQKQIKMCEDLGVKFLKDKNMSALNDLLRKPDHKYLIIDSIFGTGSNKPLPKDLQILAKTLNESQHKLIAIDIPSGVDADTGEINQIAFKADTTFTIGFPKIGLFINDGKFHSKHIEVINARFPHYDKLTNINFITEHEMSSVIPKRNPFAHKNNFGHLLIIGGQLEMLGASCLCAQAALRSGVGLVTVAVQKELLHTLQSKLPIEAMCIDLERINESMNFSTIIIGPGLGQNFKSNILLIENILSKFKCPILFDADALNTLSEDNNLWNTLTHYPGEVILTPHVGEFAKLSGLSKDEISKNTLDSINKLKEIDKVNIILKDTATVLIRPKDGIIFVNFCANSALAKGGSGDTLCGILGSLISQFEAKKETYILSDVLSLGVFIHSLAARLAAHKKGEYCMQATDLIAKLPKVFKKLDRNVS